MKKLVFILLLALSISSCSNDESVIPNTSSTQKTSTKRLSASENVKLLSAWTSYSQKYGYASYTRRFKVEVKNLAYNKIVVISHKMSDGSWKDFPLKYISSTIDNTEIWGAELIVNNSFYVGDLPSLLFADEFVARYEVNGQKFWDNNGSKNYKMTDLEGTFLRTDLNLTVDTTYSAIYDQYNGVTNIFNVNVDVRNISPTKLVNVVYTTDNWNTTKTAALSFKQYITVGAQQTLTSPNVHGMERWGVNIDVPVSVTNIQFAVVYKVNGVEYWDNNFGKNYTVTK